MTQLDIMKHAKNYLEQLANGIDPLTGEVIEDDSVINNVRISRCLFYTCSVLQKVIDNGGEVTSTVKTRKNLVPFTITEEQATHIAVSETPIGISEFVERVKAVLPENVKPMPFSRITQWLVDNEYLQENFISGKRKKFSTVKGESIGIYTLDGVTIEGMPYKKVVYAKEAQQFLIANLNRIENEAN